MNNQLEQQEILKLITPKLTRVTADNVDRYLNRQITFRIWGVWETSTILGATPTCVKINNHPDQKNRLQFGRDIRVLPAGFSITLDIDRV